MSCPPRPSGFVQTLSTRCYSSSLAAITPTLLFNKHLSLSFFLSFQPMSLVNPPPPKGSPELQAISEYTAAKNFLRVQCSFRLTIAAPAREQYGRRGYESRARTRTIRGRGKTCSQPPSPVQNVPPSPAIAAMRALHAFRVYTFHTEQRIIHNEQLETSGGGSFHLDRRHLCKALCAPSLPPPPPQNSAPLQEHRSAHIPSIYGHFPTHPPPQPRSKRRKKETGLRVGN